MPQQLTTPGVYIEEVPSSVHTIAGVSTSNAAFVDAFQRGPVDKPVRIDSWNQFTRVFGGLDHSSEASYGIWQFYLNGGHTAYVVRVAPGAEGASVELPAGAAGPAPKGDAAKPAKAPAKASAAAFKVEATSPGSWGNQLQVAAVATVPPTGPGATSKSTTFELWVQEVGEVRGKKQVLNSEILRNLTVDPASPRYAPHVVNDQSNLISVLPPAAGSLPQPTTVPATKIKYQSLVGGTDSQPLTFTPLDNGMQTLDQIAPFIFNILCIPAAAKLNAADFTEMVAQANEYCTKNRAFFLVDIPQATASVPEMVAWMSTNANSRSANSAVYFPRLEMPDPLTNRMRNVAPSGTLAGIYARTDNAVGVWKAPAGTHATLHGANPAVKVNDSQDGEINQLGINGLRSFPVYGNLSWGARTLEGADQIESEWKYIPVRRLTLFIEQSLYEGMKWAVFEPNDEALWSSIRLNVGAFLAGLMREGAFQGTSPTEAYFVECNSSTTTQTDIDNGIVNVLVGIAPVKPAEFVVVKIQLEAGQ